MESAALKPSVTLLGEMGAVERGRRSGAIPAVPSGLCNNWE